MRKRFSGIVFIVAVIFGSLALGASPVQDHPGVCPSDTKLIGQVRVFGDQNEASWWRLIYNGMIAAGLTTEDQQRDYLNGVYGTSFTTLDEVKMFNLQDVSDAFDKNHNGFVCAYELRGTRAFNDDPYFEFTWFGVSDDKIRR